MLKFWLYSFILVLFVACNDDFSINGKWTDQTIVYGLLNQTDSAQYIKINKAFLGDGDAWEMALQADSIQYNDTLDVQLIEYSLKNTTYNPLIAQSWQPNGKIIQLYRTSEITKSDTAPDGTTGTFGAQLNYLYKTIEKLANSRKYKLQIVVPGKTDTITSETFLIYDLNVQNPKPDVGLSKSYVDLSDSVKPYTTTWNLAMYGKVYQCQVKFHYIDITGSDTTWQTIDFNYPELTAQNVRIPSTQSIPKLSQKIGGSEFFIKIKNNIPVKANVKRKAVSLDFYYWVAGDNYYTYKSIKSTTNGFGQENTSYSNIINAIGFFDSRYVYAITGKELKGTTLDELANGNYTKNLNFADGHGIWK
jgi:hypothetical protein